MEKILDDYLIKIINELEKQNSKEFNNLKKNIESSKLSELKKEIEVKLVISRLISLALDSKDGYYKNVNRYINVLNEYKIPRKKINYNRITYLFEIKLGNEITRTLEIKSNYSLLDLGISSLLSLKQEEIKKFYFIFEGYKYTTDPLTKSSEYSVYEEYMNDMNLSVNDEMILFYGNLSLKLKLIDTIFYDKTITWKVPKVIKGEGNIPEPISEYTKEILNLLGTVSLKTDDKIKEFNLTKCNSKIRNLYSLFVEIYTDFSERNEFGS